MKLEQHIVSDVPRFHNTNNPPIHSSPNPHTKTPIPRRRTNTTKTRSMALPIDHGRTNAPPTLSYSPKRNEHLQKSSLLL